MLVFLEVVFSLNNIFSFYQEVQRESCFSAIKYFSVPFSTYAQPSECFCKSGRDLNVLNSFTCSILSDGRVGLGLCFPLGVPWFIGLCSDMECTLRSLDLWCPFQGSSVTVECMSSFCLSNICTLLDPDNISDTWITMYPRGQQFRLNIRKWFFTHRVVGHWKRLPGAPAWQSSRNVWTVPSDTWDHSVQGLQLDLVILLGSSGYSMFLWLLLTDCFLLTFLFFVFVFVEFLGFFPV